ncbi:hypothetical protein [Streptomyces vinaceus]|uniref:hypothetical protein n=1 Tax=Streptomyces vinaceus TaxID=1960 RepID=UPI0035E1D72B
MPDADERAPQPRAERAVGVRGGARPGPGRDPARHPGHREVVGDRMVGELRSAQGLRTAVEPGHREALPLQPEAAPEPEPAPAPALAEPAL